MVDSSVIDDKEPSHDESTNFNTSDTQETTTNHQETSFLCPITTDMSPPLNSQTVHRSYETNTESYDDNTPLESFMQYNQSNLVNFDQFSCNINLENQQTINDDYNLLSTTQLILKQAFSQSILAQALPESLAATSGWYSELLDSLLPISNEMETNLNFNNNNNNDENFIQENENYQNINTINGPPIIFSSTDEFNRAVNEISSSTMFPSTSIKTSSISEYSNITLNDCTNHEAEINLMENQQISLVNTKDNEAPTPPPIIIRKTVPNNTITYQQNVSVRYLQPPTPPPHGPIIIREVCPAPPPPEPPVKIRQVPPPAITPPPLVIRTRPPPAPRRLSPTVIEKILPPPPRPPPRMIVERFAACPPKPADVIIERWLPYKRTDRRQIFYQRVPATNIRQKEPNILIIHERPQARIHKEFINGGVVQADPQSYLQRYAAELDSDHKKSQFANIIGEATRVVPPPQTKVSTIGQHSLPQSPTSYLHRYQPSPSASVSNAWDKMKSSSPIPHLGSYPDEYSKFDSSSRYSPQFPDGIQDGNMKNMIEITDLWSGHDNSSSSGVHLPSYQFSSPSSLPPSRTIQVNTDDELQHVLSNLTHGQVPSPLRSY
ncbi:unnamed protein product [Rotaria sp. Silwood2]|nr:unnamed protein product [Rotaria sp. Silwood2]CAF3982484.1 unnamed protein product [Rotaria sp. Silwood2]